MLNVDFEKVIGKIKPMHGVGQPPFNGIDDSMFHYLQEAHIPYSRTHDVGGEFGLNMFVDIHNIFRDFNADENDPASYDFVFTDWLISSLIKHNCDIVYRLGETIENYFYMRAYRIYPPRDYKKWAVICEHIIRHYNEGWADGFKYGITYWEIWNEPENGRPGFNENQMWMGTAKEYFELYTVAAKHLKACFGDSIKVGGYASTGFRYIVSDPSRFGIDAPKSDDPSYANDRAKFFADFFIDFLEYIKLNDAPLDFFSWHSYLSTRNTLTCAEYVNKKLNEYGYTDVETQVNEWNNGMEDRETWDEIVKYGRALRGSGMAAAKACAMMCAMQNTRTNVMCYYDARISPSYYAGMFNSETRAPRPLYYAFYAFGELYCLGDQVECVLEGEAEGVYAIAAKNGTNHAVLIANESDENQVIKTNLPTDMDLYLVDDVNCLDKIDADSGEFILPAGSVILLK